MNSYKINSLTSGAISIKDLKITKIVEISDNFMYLLMEGWRKASIYKLNLLQPGELTFVANVINNGTIKIVSGNLWHLYDSLSKSFYELSGT